MRTKTYAEWLRDPRWQKKRLKIMEYANFRCQICGRKDLTLHCHHSYYAPPKRPWQYPNGSIICVCEKCHDWIHGRNQPKSLKITPAELVQLEIPDYLSLPVNPSTAAERFSALRKMLEGGK